MIIGVISDTHIPERADRVPDQVFETFKNADLIIHAGDLTSLEVLKSLSEIAEVKAVCGNMDPELTSRQLPEKKIIKTGNFTIGVIHGSGHPNYLLDFVTAQFNSDIDVIVFGHSHRPFNEKKGKTLFFNPGSPTDIFFSSYRSCGILEINDTINGRIIKLDNG